MINLELWESVSRTDPAFTKAYKGPGGFQGTAVSPTYVNMKATEIFGPVGIGWGWEVLVDRYDVGAPIREKDGENKGAVICHASMHVLKIKLWYILKGSRGEVEHYGCTPFVSETKYGPNTDFEAPKKSLTDAIKKCLVQIGFAADIYMGLYDDEHYLNEVSDAAALERAENKIDEKAKQDAEYREWLANNIRLIETATNLNELQKLYSSVIRKLDLRKDEAGKLKATKAKDIRKAELAPNAEATA